MLMLATDDQELLRALGLSLLWSEGYVEPVVPTPTPNHVAAQQLLALALQEGRVGRHTWPEWFAGLPLAEPEAWREIADWLVSTGHLDVDSDMLFIGPEAERKYGRRHFMEIMSVFTSDPQILILHGRNEIGVVDPMVMLAKVSGPRIIALGGRSWLVTSVDWTRRRAHVEPIEGHGLARWAGRDVPRSFELTDAMRRVVLGANPPDVTVSRRAAERIAAVRDVWGVRVDFERTVLWREDDSLCWWTWVGGKGNAVLHAALTEVAPHLLDPDRTFDNEQVMLHPTADMASLSDALSHVRHRFGRTLAGIQPQVDQRAIDGLKFSDLLPPDLAEVTLAARLADPHAGLLVVDRPVVFRAGVGTQE